MNSMVCRNCGASAFVQEGNLLKCKYCGITYQAERENKVVEKIRGLLDDYKQEMVANLRQRLYEQIHTDPPDSKTIVEICRQIRNYIPDDYIASFYEATNAEIENRLIKFIDEIDVETNYPFIEMSVRYLITRSLTSNLNLHVGDLIERAAQQGVFDVKKQNELQTLFETEKEKIDNDVYNTKAPRDFFVMYSSKDMPEVKKLVSFLEEQGKTCFVALRNIQHGRGSQENYISMLKSAMDHCECVLFVSSSNSRNTKCQAVDVEIEYIKQKDVNGAPPEYRNRPYHKIPYNYKKRRIEYLIEQYNGKNIMGEEIVKQFFHGLEYIKGDPVQVLRRYHNPDEGVTASESAGASAASSEGREAYNSKDYEAAAGIFEEQARAGDAQAMCNFGYCLEIGRGVDRDCEEAVEWYKRAADNGNARAMYNLGVCYEAGVGVARDPDSAYDYISKAAKNGDQRAKDWLKTH